MQAHAPGNARYGERKYPCSETKYKNLKHGG